MQGFFCGCDLTEPFTPRAVLFYIMSKLTLFWHRRDFRLEDNAGLYHALKNEENVQPLFVFDCHILDSLEDLDDARVTFIYNQTKALKDAYRKQGADLWVFYGSPLEVFRKLCSENQVKAVYTNRDYEPYAKKRDAELESFLNEQGSTFKTFKDHVIFEKEEITKDDGQPYTIYSPYANKWKAKLSDFQLKKYPVITYFSSLRKAPLSPLITLAEMGFKPSQTNFPKKDIPQIILENYHQTRDIPSLPGTSRLSIHLRFGTISIRKLVAVARNVNQKYLSELIWRDFYQSIIYHFPDSINKAFKPVYDNVEWLNDEVAFDCWCKGKTGYPFVDAGMRELNTTGFMHNRARMITASFLTKHLLIDWRWGEAYFASKLLDFELASNVGGWQWAAGSGCDAAPYFRVFNPLLQAEKFDPQRLYIKKWIPEIDTKNYPKPIIDHKFARNRALEAYKKALQ